RAALYARVSTDKQVEKYGIPSQLEALRKRCLEKDWAPVFDADHDAFIDEGHSGAELDRPALNRLRQAAKEGKVNVVLAYDPDRLSRKLFHLMILYEEFKKQGIELEFITQDMGTSPEDKMFFNMRGVLGEYEREKIRERTMRGSREKARQGKVVNASVPFGFRYNKEKSTLEENPETAKTIRWMFYTFANETLSLLGLAERLNHLHVSPPRSGNRWRASTLGIMLKNEAYIGKMQQFKSYRVEPQSKLKPATKTKKTSTVQRPREEWVAVTVPSLIPADLFDTVQRKLKRNSELATRNTKRDYLLSGLLYCSQCGGRMGGHFTHGIPYYRCYRTSSPDRVPLGTDGRPQACSCPEIRAEEIEAVVWDTLSQLVKDPAFLIQELHRQYADDSQTREMLEKELQLCQARLKTIPDEQRRLVEGYRRGLYADFMMREEMENTQREQSELEKRKAELERQLARKSLTQGQENRIKSLVEKIGRGLDNLDFGGKRELLRLLVEKVIFDGQKVEVQTVIPLGDQLHPIHRGG
ncbi:MAG: recombinase family protein, partial [Chloroflexota bacterium]